MLIKELSQNNLHNFISASLYLDLKKLSIYINIFQFFSNQSRAKLNELENVILKQCLNNLIIKFKTMGIKSSIKKVIGKGAMKVSKTKVGKKIMDKAMEKELEKMPEGQREQAKKVMQNMQNMSIEEQEEIAEKMKKLMGGKENPSAGEMMGIMRKMSPEQRKEYEELARKMMGM